MAEFKSISIEVFPQPLETELPAYFSRISIEVLPEQIEPELSAYFSRISIETGIEMEEDRLLLRQLTVYSRLPFMPAKTISAIKISEDSEPINLLLQYDNPIDIDEYFGLVPDAIRTIYNADFTAADLITAETYPVSTQYTAQKPERILI